MTVVKWLETVVLASTFALGFASFSNAEETVKDKTVETGKDFKKNAKQAGRNVKDEACEMVNGKMECAGKKIKHKTQNAVDEVKDKVDAD
jgi:hypothetical protein